MEKQRELHQTLILAFILLTGTGLFLWQAGFFDERSKLPTCSREYIQFCTSKELCEKINLYWWDNSCHFAKELKPEPPICSKEYIHLCDTEDLCEEINLYWWDDYCHTNEKPEPKPSEYPDYNLLKNLTPLTIIENTISWSPEAKKEDIISYKKQLRSTGQFARIYLYAEASVGDKPLTQYESLYVKMNNVGGHIFRPQSLKIPVDSTTHLLYAINNIPYLPKLPYAESRTPSTANWFDFFEDDSLITVNIFISSLKPATLDKIILYYDCAEGSNCKIEIK